MQDGGTRLNRDHRPAGGNVGLLGVDAAQNVSVQFTIQLPGWIALVAPLQSTRSVAPSRSTTSSTWSMITSFRPAAIVLFSASERTPSRKLPV